MMKKTLKSLAMLAFAALAVSSCQKENLRENEVTPGKQIEISVNGLMGEYQVADATKADLVNTVRVAWTAGDKVFAYSADGYLGELTASLDESGDDRYAKLSGTITDPGKTITLVYSPLLTSSNKSLLFSDGKLSLNFATQDGAKVPFVVYGTLDVTGSISGKIVPFKFATSVMKVNCTGLSEEEDITKAEVNNVNTVCEITFKDDAAPDIAGKTLGTITRKGTGAFCSADSRAIFQLAIVATEAAQPSERVLTVSQDKDYVADFSACALASGKSYNSVYAMSPAPTFKAVYNTTGDANTLTFYYDAEDHSSEGTVYEGSTGDYYLCKDEINADAKKWGYNGIRGSIKGVVFDKSVAGYHGLTSTAFMFSDFTNTASISGEELLDMSNVTNMRSMFGGVGVFVNPFNEVLNISGWNTSKVQNLNNMFLNYGRNLTNFTLDLSGWDVTNVTTATDMFKQSGYSSTSWSVTIPAKTTLKAGGEKANTASEWYMGDGTTTVAPESKGTFIISIEGVLPGEFSVSETRKVKFSKGNLRYNTTTSKWSFFDKQYECGPSSYESGHNTEISLFNWGYNATNSVVPDSEFADNSSVTKKGASLKKAEDWGYIFGGESSVWRTLSQAEWAYLLGTVKNDSGSYVPDESTGSRYMKFGLGTVCDVKGMIILPDVWAKPSGLSDFVPTTMDAEGIPQENDPFSQNQYTAEQWTAMESAGAVFLPSSGRRSSSNVYDVGIVGDYWSRTHGEGSYVYSMSFSSYGIYPDSGSFSDLGSSVRLVTVTAGEGDDPEDDDPEDDDPEDDGTLEAGYYIVGIFDGVEYWDVGSLDSSMKLTEDEYDPGVYTIVRTFCPDDQVAVVQVEEGEISAWYYGENEDPYAVKIPGECILYFCPEGKPEWEPSQYITIQNND